VTEESVGEYASSIGTNRRNLLRIMRSNAFAVVVGLPVQLLLLPIVLDDLDLRRFGQWSTLAALLSIVGLAEAGLPTEVTRRIADALGRGVPEQGTADLRKALAVVGVAGLGVFLLSVPLSSPVVELVFPGTSAGERNTLRGLLVATTALLALSLLAGTWVAALNGLQRTDVGAVAGMVAIVASAVATLLGLWLGWGLWALLLASGVRSLVALSAPAVFLWRMGDAFRPRFARFSRPEAWSLLSGSGLLMVAALANVFDYQFDKLVLSRYSGAQVAGHYQIGTTLSLEARALALVPAGVLLAGAAELRSQASERLRRLLATATSATACVAGIALGGLMSFARPFLTLWLGDGYSESVRATVALAGALLISTSTATWYFYAAGTSRQRVIAVSATGNLACNVTCALLLTPRIGLDGALIGSFAGHLVGAVLMYVGVQRSDPVLRIGLVLRPLLVIAVAVAVPLWLVRDSLHSWLALAVAATSWVVVVCLALVVVRATPVTLGRTGRKPRLIWR
jgi:O-antigen/teichoic acid export membrane protein